MLVYRIETGTGRGPYHFGGPAILYPYDYPACQPSPWDYYSTGTSGEKFFTIPDPHFAFVSIDQLINWFDILASRVLDQWNRMRYDADEYYLRVFEVDERYVVSDRHQATFSREKGEMVKQIPLALLPFPIDAKRHLAY